MNASTRQFRSLLPGFLGIALSLAAWSAALAQSSTSGPGTVSARESRMAALRARPYRSSRNVVGSGQRASYGPAYASRAGQHETFESIPPGAAYVGEGDVTYEVEGAFEGEFGGCENCDGGCCGDSSCGGCVDCCGWSLPVICIPLPYLQIENLSAWVGVHGAKNLSHLGAGAGFGFEEGLNVSSSMPGLSRHGISYQLGLNLLQSELSGNEFTSSSRDQYYFTAGVFRRVDWGLQGGVAVDYLRDQWYFDDFGLTQVRAEVSWVYPCTHEIGFMYSGSIDDTTTVVGAGTSATNVALTVSNVYSVFYRRRFNSCSGAEGRFYAGVTDDSDGVFGGNVSVPINESWSLNAAFDYLIPEESNGPDGDFNEDWYVGIRMVWTPGGRGCDDPCGYNRPLFDVANPGSFGPVRTIGPSGNLSQIINN